MKHRLVFPLALMANMAPLCLCLLYREGAMLVYPALAMMHILLFLLNLTAAKTKLQVILLSLIHIAATIGTHQLCGWLYLHHVCDDAPGRAILMLGTWAGAVWTTVLLVASVLIYHRKHAAQRAC